VRLHRGHPRQGGQSAGAGGDRRAAGEAAEVAQAVEIARDAEPRHQGVEDHRHAGLDAGHEQHDLRRIVGPDAQRTLRQEHRRPPAEPETPQQRRAEPRGRIDETHAPERLHEQHGQADERERRREHHDRGEVG
jgi:hypothetical protein